jgi:hypothetical protein
MKVQLEAALAMSFRFLVTRVQREFRRPPIPAAMLAAEFQTLREMLIPLRGTLLSSMDNPA